MRKLQSTAIISLLTLFSVTTYLTGMDHKSSQGGLNIANAPLLEKVAEGAAFSFLYDGKPSQQILPQWKQVKSSKSLSGGRVLHITTYSDPATLLEVSSEITSFADSPAIECVLRFRNNGARDTPIVENILPLELRFVADGAGKMILHYAKGSMGQPDDFSPIDKEVVSGAELRLAHYVLDGPRHVDGQLPFFNLQWQEGGLIGAVGWTGQWAVRVSGEGERKVLVQAGQQKTHLKLHPNESIRTPRILLLQWQGPDRLIGHNQFRKLLFSHYVPRLDGQIVEPLIANSNAFVYEYEAVAKQTGRNPLDVVATLKPGEEKSVTSFADAALNAVNETNQLDFIRGIPPVGMELYWLDAGWFEGEWPFGVGTWDPDPAKFPHGLKLVGDAAHAKGFKFLLWFEPGRVGSGSRIAIQHPEWVLHQPMEGKLGGLFNFGDAAALRWMTETLSSRIKDWGIDIYRQDSNICPLPFWQASDDLDREGITEIHWIEGLYELWDGLLRQHPKLMIDNANWRITGPDIEVMSRSVGSLTRSETEVAGVPHPSATQLQTAELSLWAPISMGAANGFDPYTFRSAATNGVGTGLDLRASYIPLAQVKAGIEEVKSLRPFWTGDYYPLTEITLDEQQWIGWEFYRPDLNAGFALFFRRPMSQQSVLKTELKGLEPAMRYEVTFSNDYEAKEKRTMTGRELSQLFIESNAKPGSVLIRFQQVDKTK